MKDGSVGGDAAVYRREHWIGMASGAGYRIAAVCAAVLCGIGGVVFAFYNERKVLDVLES